MIFKAVVLGIVQGLAEFLPISSSAHLILARAFFGWDGDQFGLPFDVALHVGTLLAILVYFRDDLLRMLAAAPGMFSRHASGPARLAWLVVIGTLPVVVVGLLLRNSKTRSGRRLWPAAPLPSGVCCCSRRSAWAREAVTRNR